MPERIFLAGFMGSGKSTVAPILASRLSFEVVELDDVIARRAGRSIPEIFEEEGEEGFRRRERTMLEETVERSDVVVSLGGGAVTDEENLSLVRESGTLVYLRVPVEVLTDRLYGSERRPLLQDESGDLLARAELRRRIAGMMDERAAFYRRAHHVVDAGAPAPAETADEIIRAIG